VTACLEYLERYARPFGDARGGATQRSLEEFISDGVGFQADLKMVVHGELEAHEVNNSELKRWMRECQHRERELGGLMLRIGTPQQVAAYVVVSRAEQAKAEASRREFEQRKRLADQQPAAPDGTKAAQCPDCGRRFATKAGRDEHLAAKHQPQPTARSSKPDPAAARVLRAASPSATKAVHNDDVEIVVPGPELDPYTLPGLEEDLIRVVASGKTRIVLDLTRTFFDEEVNVFRLGDTVRGQGGTLAFVAPDRW
jgi:hypothetical protein